MRKYHMSYDLKAFYLTCVWKMQSKDSREKYQKVKNVTESIAIARERVKIGIIIN